MLKYFFLLLTFLVLTTSGVLAETRQIANPIYLGNMLVDATSVDKMEQICRYYSLIEENPEDGFKTFVHSDGTVIQFKFDMSDNRKIPVVKLKTKTSSKIINEILSTIGYSHTPDGYVKGSKFEHRRTKCSVVGTTKKTLTFTKEYNSLE